MALKTRSKPALQVDMAEAVPTCVTLAKLSPEQITALSRFELAGGRLGDLLTLHVAQPQAPVADSLPAMAGRYAVTGDALRFTPLFPFEPGVSYRATFHAEALLFTAAEVAPLSLEFHVPATPKVTPQVQQIFPTAESLPENLLRFYVLFSVPMQRGQAQEQVSLLGPDGLPAPDVLYRAPVELWDPGMRVLTVLLDPGRLKRGVGPNRELGPPLKIAERYTLVIGSGMLAGDGSPLAAPVSKTFHVGPAVRRQIEAEHWRWIAPVSGSRDPVVLIFPRPLDWASLAHSLTVTTSRAQVVNGQAIIHQGERRWSFTPALPWSADTYQMRVHAGLEDICGNTLHAPFDRPMRSHGDLLDEQALNQLDFALPFLCTSPSDTATSMPELQVDGGDHPVMDVEEAGGLSAELP